ncbi:unnamed protein product [Urochloa decumbens]|uniref:KIB1-4 beta-propeller domain-containing protein n=1 Tax=Urochloa decumbens TaxID=240449 RepID=A0ABC9B8D8_9POAL
MASSTGWADLPADLLGGVIARLPFPGDRAAICAACRAWRSAARHHVRHQAPWIVLPDCSVCTTGRDGAFFDRIPGLPGENVTCLAAAGEGWLALDLTDDAFRRTPSWDMYCPATGTFSDARPDVKHTHRYMLHNPFSGQTVPLPELDGVVGHVAETFEIRKVLMRSAPDDVIAVTTNNCNYNIILCRPGKGTFVLPDLRVVDAAFVGDVLYGITTGEELLAFHLGEDGKPNVTRVKRVIKNPMAAYYIKYSSWRWPQIVDDDSSGDDDGRGDYDHEDYSDGDEVEIQEDQAEFDDDPDIRFINGDGMVSDNEGKVYQDDWDPEVPYDAKDETYIARYLVSCGDELLLVRHQNESPLQGPPYTSKVEVFRADVSVGRWVPVTADDGGLGEGEALFLSRSFSKSTRAHGRDVEEGLVYYASNYLDDAFDTRSGTIRNIAFRWPWQRQLEYKRWLTWLFPPELVV